jgi:hypothetical protein
MDKIGPGVVADTAEFQIQACLSKPAGLVSREADVDGTSQHVVAELGHTGTLLAEPGIGLGGAVAGNDVKGGVRSHVAFDGIEQVYQLGIHILEVAGAMISQNVVDALHGIGAIGSVLEIAKSESFTGVGVEKGERTPPAVRQQG